MIYKNSSCKCECSSCKNCESLQKKVFYLVKTVDLISKGKSNFENVLASQFFFLENLVWVLIHKARTVAFQNLFSTITEYQPIEKFKQPVVSCFYCMRKGHSVRFCKNCKFFVPKGILKWILKNLNGSYDQPNMKGYKFFKG